MDLNVNDWCGEVMKMATYRYREIMEAVYAPKKLDKELIEAFHEWNSRRPDGRRKRKPVAGKSGRK